VSALLSRSRTANQNRDRILAELEPEEQILAVAEGSVLAQDGYGSSRYVGAIVVTDGRLICVESKPFGRLGLTSLPWHSVREDGVGSGPDRLGVRGVDSTGRWRLWQIECPAGDEEMALLREAIATARASE
jgi:Bacterial PH domain